MANKGGPRKAAYDRAFNARPEEKKKRAQRNAARARMMDAGRVSKGDGMDVDHKMPIRRGGGNGVSNLRVVGKRVNRGWR